MLAALSVSSNVTTAAKAAQISRDSHYRWLREDPEYALAVTDAHEQAVDSLEQEGWRRAREGLRSYKFFQGVPLMIRCPPDHPDAEPRVTESGETLYFRHYYELRFSDTLLIFLLKGERPDKYRDRYDIRQETEVTQNIYMTIEERVRAAQEKFAGLPAALRKRMTNGNADGIN